MLLYTKKWNIWRRRSRRRRRLRYWRRLLSATFIRLSFQFAQHTHDHILNPCALVCSEFGAFIYVFICAETVLSVVVGVAKWCSSIWLKFIKICNKSEQKRVTAFSFIISTVRHFPLHLHFHLHVHVQCSSSLRRCASHQPLALAIAAERDVLHLLDPRHDNDSLHIF